MIRSDKANCRPTMRLYLKVKRQSKSCGHGSLNKIETGRQWYEFGSNKIASKSCSHLDNLRTLVGEHDLRMRRSSHDTDSIDGLFRNFANGFLGLNWKS